jgi:CHAD domain-containing protein
LHVFADVFDPARADALSDELSWFAGLLGEIRDADVAGRRLEKLFEDADASFASASARTHFENAGAAIRTAAYDALTSAMNGRRYAALVGMLEDWRIDPPYLETADQPSKAARGYVTTTAEKLRKRLRAATKKSADVEDLHRARKVAKRLR